jgi:Holliday junction resolvasome RuvABC endonuclease subunit
MEKSRILNQRLNILAIDPGLNKTGWAFLRCFKNAIQKPCILSLECGVIKIKNKGDHAERIKRLHVGLKNLMASFQSIDVFLVESLFVNMSWKTSMILAYSKAIVLLVSRGEVHEWHNVDTKKFLSGTKWPSKKLTSLSVKYFLNRDISQDQDSLDAASMCLGWYLKNLS